MTAIRLGAFYGSRLNLNGDQGNLLALKRYLEAAGYEVEVVAVGTTEQALSCNFLLLGHGSMAAMASLQERLMAFDWQKVMSTIPGLTVGSGTEWLATHGFAQPIQNRGERVSEFQVGNLGEIKVLGYRNTDTDLANIALSQQFLVSMLHGPVLAKNPILLHKAAVATLKSAGLDWNPPTPGALKDWVEILNSLSSQIWSLETQDEFVPLPLA